MKERKSFFHREALRLETKFTPFMGILLRFFHMPKMELAEFLKAELETNVFLDEKTEHGESEEEEKEDFELEEFIQGVGEDVYSLKTRDEEKDDPLELVAAPPPSLYERMKYQIESYFKKDIDRKIAYVILENLNRDGYLEKEPRELAEFVGVSENKFEEIRKKFMRFDPVGIGARNITESVEVQLRERGEKEKIIETVIKCVQGLCEDKELHEIKQKFNLTDREIDKVFKLVKTILPRPALKYSEEQIRYVYPEVVVIKRENKLIPIVDESGLPRIKINRRYLKLMKSKSLASQEKKVLRKHLQRAVNIFKALVQRKINLLKITEFIIERNRGFFEGKSNKVSPITQSDAAQEIGIKSSTFHKLVSSKYIDTPRGIFEMRFFFPGGIKIRGGRMSREKVKEMIKEIVDKEDKKNPFTDEVIAEILQADGIKIKRRTVQKIREEMGIPSSNRRKKR